MKVRVDKIASATRNVTLQREVTVSGDIVCAEGYVLAARVLNDKAVYDTLELLSGRMSQVCKGDVIVGVLGARNALRGYSGVVPEALRPGDTVQLLNLGGVLGCCTGFNPDVGEPFNAEVLGAVLSFPSFTSRIGVPAHVRGGPVKPRETLGEGPPLVIVTGTCMNAGKTRATCEIIKGLSRIGRKVGAAKLSGISLMRDTLEMADFGAVQALSFSDAGVVSTSPSNVVPVAKGVVHELWAQRPDAVVVEFGDGIMGEYGVLELLSDAELMAPVRAHVLAANDPVGAWGAIEFLRGKCPKVDVVCGPATDNRAGTRFIEGRLGIAAANALRDGHRLARLVMSRLGWDGDSVVGESP